MKRKLIDESDNNSLKKQKMSKKRNRDETIFDIIVFKKVKINNEKEDNDIQKYTQYRRDILIYT